MKKSIIIASLLMAGATSSLAQKVTLTTANKTDNCVNPLLPYNLCADPTAVEYNGRLYVYGTNDQQELNVSKNTSKNSYGNIRQLVCMSSADLVNWTFHGVIDVKSISSWMNCSWAPSIVSRVEKDGKTHFYLYYTNQASGVGVLTSTSPTGPWKDPIGKALINWNTPGRGNQSNIIDPGVCIDDEGNGWLSFGGGDPNSTGSKLHPGNARIVKLESNMTSFKTENIREIDAPFHFEANELNYINGKFVFSYSGGWSCNSGDWSKYDGKGSYGCPANCSILSMQSEDPMDPSSWKYTGEILKNPGNYGYSWGNNHSHLQKFGNAWYTLYHTQYLESKMGISGGYRGIAISKTTVNESTVKITAPTMNNTGPTAITAARPLANTVLEAEMMANGAGISVTKPNTSTTVITDIEAGDWTMVRNLHFPEEAKSLTVRIKGKGKLELRPNKSTAAPIATVEFNSSSLRNVQVDLESVIPEGKTYNYLYLVFTEASGTIQFDRYQFSPLTIEEATAIGKVGQMEFGPETYFDMNGVKREEAPEKGLYIRQRTMSDGTRKVVKIIK